MGVSTKTKVNNVYRTYRETKEMFQDEAQGVEDLAERLFRLLDCIKYREGAQEALAPYGILTQPEMTEILWDSLFCYSLSEYVGDKHKMHSPASGLDRQQSIGNLCQE